MRKFEQVSGQIQSLNDSLDEIKARIGRSRKDHPGRPEPAAVHERHHSEPCQPAGGGSQWSIHTGDVLRLNSQPKHAA